MEMYRLYVERLRKATTDAAAAAWIWPQIFGQLDDHPTPENSFRWASSTLQMIRCTLS